MIYLSGAYFTQFLPDFTGLSLKMQEKTSLVLVDKRGFFVANNRNFDKRFIQRDFAPPIN